MSKDPCRTYAEGLYVDGIAANRAVELHDEVAVRQFHETRDVDAAGADQGAIAVDGHCAPHGPAEGEFGVRSLPANRKVERTVRQQAIFGCAVGNAGVEVGRVAARSGTGAP